MSYKSYNKVFCPISIFKSMFSLPIDKFRQNFSPLRGRYISPIILFYALVCHLTFFLCRNFRRNAPIPGSSILPNRIKLSEQKNVFLSVKIVNSVNDYNKNSVYDVLYLSQNVLYSVAELSYNPIFFSSKVREHPALVRAVASIMVCFRGPAGIRSRSDSDALIIIS